MTAVIRVVGLATGERSGCEGQYVAEYEPAAMKPDGTYAEGGVLRLCRRREDARQFDTPSDAVLFYRQANGLRPDGHPNRPMTCYTIEIESCSER